MTPQRSPRLIVEGNHILYHFLQKTLLESNAEQFRQLTAHLVAALGIWLSPDVYRLYPLLVPYAVRDPSCRGDRSKGMPDEWGAPDSAGLFRDDNSLIKALPRSLPVTNASNLLFNKRFMGKGFVASHVWRELVPSGHASRERSTYSFVPNLVWLPSQVSKLSDREGQFVQTHLQLISLSIYRNLELTSKLKGLVESIWDRLSLGPEVNEIELPDPSTLNYFRFDAIWLARRVKTLDLVIRALEDVRDRGRPLQKTLSARYTERLSTVSTERITQLLSELTSYSEAVEEARVAAETSNAQ